MNAELDAARSASRAREIEILTDAPSRVAPLLAEMAAVGFTRQTLSTIPAAESLSAQLAIRPGPLASSEVDVAALLIVVDAHVRGLGIDCLRYPVQRQSEKCERTQVILPVGACGDGRRPPYAGVYRDRYEVRVECDDRPLGQAFVDELAGAGFRPFRRILKRTSDGFTIRHPASTEGRQFADLLSQHVEAAMRRATGGDLRFGVTFVAAEISEVVVAMPLAAAASGELAALLTAADRFDCKILAADIDAPAVRRLRDRLAPMGWNALVVERKTRAKGGCISYGGAPEPLLGRVRSVVGDVLPEVVMRLEQEWSSSDRDVWISLPGTLPAEQGATPAAAAPPAAAAIVAALASDRPFVVLGDDHVRVGRHVLPRRAPHALSPHPAIIDRYVIDQVTAETLDHVAASVVANEPCLIEGATATSKTSAVLFLGALLRQPVIRLNLSGQTDTSELIGRYAPAEAGWRWHDGAVPDAMRHGYWLALDEVNLCEASIVERLNPVLENPPSLHLSECDGRMIGGAGGDRVDPRFRVFASLNPAEGYVGRSPLSPAFKDRFVGFRRTRRAGESDVRDQLVFLLEGRQPEVVVDGVRYPAHHSGHVAVHARLAARLPQREALIGALARFHVGAESVCEAKEGTEERPVITRRSLLGLLSRLDASTAAGEREWAASLWSSIERYYLNRVAEGATRSALHDLALATGFRRDSWRFA